MTVTLRTKPTDKIIELGGGAVPQCRPNVDIRQCYDANGQPTVDFTADFSEPLPIQSEEWDGVFSQFCLEHVAWPKVPQFLAEVYRILKPGGKAVFVIPNTESQLKWIQDHPEGWDGKPLFESASELLFGTLDYPDNGHKAYFSSSLAAQLFQAAGFEGVIVQPYGERATDLCVEAVRPAADQPHTYWNTKPDGEPDKIIHGDPDPVKPQGLINGQGEPMNVVTGKVMTRDELFDKEYFNGGQKVGGYRSDQWGTYRDFPVHEITARHVLARRPESVLEIGAARGYILKRIQDAGVQAAGYEISKHCYMTRAANNIRLWDICKTPWDWNGYQYDLCFSIATLEHIPEEFLPGVIKEMARTCRRGLHGVDFGHRDDGWDRTHVCLHDKSWWIAKFAEQAPGWPVEIVDKEELERGQFPEEVLKGDGKVKLNIGSHCVMAHHGWINIDALDLKQFAEQNGYQFKQWDVRQGLPYATGSVDLIAASHFLEHLTAAEGLTFLKECRRVIKRDGSMRIAVPDAGLLMDIYKNDPARLAEFDEINDGCEASPTAAGKLWELLHAGHAACYDEETLVRALTEAGFNAGRASFRNGHPQILRETTDCFPCLSLFMEATPLVG